ncbi:hypothetical protein P3S67_020963 [Capsicum chacoense]
MIYQFIACGKSRDTAHELASTIWLAVVDSLEENEHTFNLLKRLASEGDGHLTFPVLKVPFTDFRDCLNHVEYCHRKIFNLYPQLGWALQHAITNVKCLF